MNVYYNYFRNIYLDYYEVFKEIQKNAKSRPLKATIYGMSTLFVLNLFRTNEGLRSYNSEVISACNRIGSVSENSRNPNSYKFIQQVGKLNGHNQLRQIDLGFSTLVYKTECNPEVALFRYNCKHLQPSIKEFFQDRLIDFSLLGRWLLLEFNMKDYDINEEEYSNLSSNYISLDSNNSDNLKQH